MAHFDDAQTQRDNLIVIRRAMKTPMLERAREMELALAWRETGNQTALAELVGAYGRMVVSMALKFRHYGLPVGDLIQEGNIGLMQAAQRFEPSRDVRFATYAQWWIRAAIQDFVLRNWSIVRTGTTAAHKSLFFNLRRLRAKLDDPSADRMTDAQRRQPATVRSMPRPATKTKTPGFPPSPTTARRPKKPRCRCTTRTRARTCCAPPWATSTRASAPSSKRGAWAKTT